MEFKHNFTSLQASLFIEFFIFTSLNYLFLLLSVLCGELKLERKLESLFSLIFEDSPDPVLIKIV